VPKSYSAPIYTATTEAVKHYAAQTYYTGGPSFYVEQKYYTDAPLIYTPTYATSTNNTEAPTYYTEEASYYTTTYAVLV
jgi:hypothetical protein